MNEQQFRELYDYYIQEAYVKGLARDFNWTVETLVRRHGPQNIMNYLKYLFNLDTEVGRDCNRYGNSRGEFMYLYSDYLRLCEQIGIQNEDWKIKSVSELHNVHDEVRIIFNNMQNSAEIKRQQELFEKRKDSFEKFRYEEEGKEYVVIPPSSAMDIADEGISLHHCVKSYIDSVIAGDTNILFIRKADEAWKPFYTLEVKDKAVRQCHGMCNRDVSEVEGLSEFLAEYCEKKHIQYEEKVSNAILAVGR
jgi:hypothetical protein